MNAPIAVSILAEPATALLPLATVGCLARILPLLHKAGGRLELNGKVISMDNLARLVGATIYDVEDYLAALEEVNLLARDEVGYYCPRMVHEESVRRARAGGGHRGGNPALMRRSGPESNTAAPTTNTHSVASAPAVDDVIALITGAGASEHVARVTLDIAKRRLGEDSFAVLIVEAVAANPPNPLAWLVEQCDGRARPRRARSATQFGGLD